MVKVEYDFISFTSFPTSLIISNLSDQRYTLRGSPAVKVAPNSTLKVDFSMKVQNVRIIEGWGSYARVYGSSDGKTWRQICLVPERDGAFGTRNWKTYSVVFVTPADINYVYVELVASAGLFGKPGISWYDDLKIYQDDKLIYANDFSNWNPYIGAGALGIVGGAGAYQLTKNIPVSVGVATLGSLIGAGIGLLVPA